MLFGYCANMIADDPDGIGYDGIRIIRGAGYDYVELPVAQMMALEQSAFEARVLDELSRAELPCLCCNNFFPSRYRLTGPDARTSEALAYAEAAYERMARLGARKVVFGSSGARNCPDDFPREAAMEQLIRLLPTLGDMAAARGMDVVIEPLNRSESNLVNSVREATELARAVAHPRVRVLADTYHMGLEKEPPSAALVAGERLGHVHAARLTGRSLPVKEDEGDGLDLFLRTLHTIAYDDTLSVEAYAPRPLNAYDLFAARLCLERLNAECRAEQTKERG